MKQKEIWEIYLDPVRGSEQSGRRPAVIVSGNLLNKYLEVVIVCPLTTKIKNYKGNVILSPTAVNNLTLTSEVLTFHIRSIAKKRLQRRIGEISDKELQEIKSTVDDILRY